MQMRFNVAILNAQKEKDCPLFCQQFKNITSCCSRMTHGSVLQGSACTYWKVKMLQILPGQHTLWISHPLSMFLHRSTRQCVTSRTCRNFKIQVLVMLLLCSSYQFLS